MPDLVVGVDVGTSSTKAVLVDRLGTLHSWSRREYPMHRPFPGWAENDPDDWVAAVAGAVRDLVDASGTDPEAIRGLCIVAQRDPIVLLGPADEVLAPSISWIDLRDRAGTEEVYRRFGASRLLATTGLVPVPGLALPNIHWIRRHLPEAWRRTRRILAVKDYILFRLTGRVATDTSTPSRSMLYDLREGRWSDWICRQAALDPELLPPIACQPWDVWGELDAAAAERLGLRPGTVLAAGGGDDPAAALGAGAIEAGDVAVGTGTASCWRVIARSAEPDMSGRADLTRHLVPERFLYEVIIAGTGTSLRWYRDAFGSAPASYEDLIASAAEIRPGADGLMFYPYLEGARAPRFNEDASGVFFGLRSDHRRGHFVRAILEGIAYQYPPVLELLSSYGGRVDGALTLVDDESRSELWNRMKADIAGVTIRTLAVWHAAAMGSAILAAAACGLYSGVTAAAKAMIATADTVPPDPAAQLQYRRLRQRYEAVLEHLDEAFHAAR